MSVEAGAGRAQTDKSVARRARFTVFVRWQISTARKTCMMKRLRAMAKAAAGKRGRRFVRLCRSHWAYLNDSNHLRKIARRNRSEGLRYLNIGGGRDADAIGWWNGDIQAGFIFDQNTVLPMANESIAFAYSSMFFEHINDATAATLLREVYRVLKPGSTLRLVVPNFWLWMEKYRAGDVGYFNAENPDIRTWSRLEVPVDLEHLFASYIAAIHNKPHQLTPYLHKVDHNANPPVFMYPHQETYEGYYCGPAPELTTQAIRENFAHLGPEEFLEWIFEVTNKSAHQDPTFNSWHKNWWNEPKIERFGRTAGFSQIKRSRYGAAPIALPANIEKPGHADYGLYFELQK
jgi:SAM-dependent methyltransferase